MRLERLQRTATAATSRASARQSGATRRAQPRASRAQNPREATLISRSGHSSRPSRVLGVDPRGMNEDADFFCSRRLNFAQVVQQRGDHGQHPGRRHLRELGVVARQTRRRRRVHRRRRAAGKRRTPPPAIDPGSSFCSSARSREPRGRGRGVLRHDRGHAAGRRGGDENDAHCAAFSRRSWRGRADRLFRGPPPGRRRRGFPDGARPEPSVVLQDAATHRNRRRRTARSTDSAARAPRLCSAWHSATTRRRGEELLTSRVLPARGVERIASRRHRAAPSRAGAEDALRSRSVRLRAARARFSRPSASSPC